MAQGAEGQSYTYDVIGRPYFTFRLDYHLIWR